MTGRRVRFKRGVLSGSHYRRLVDYLNEVLGVDHRRYICSEPGLVCFNGVCVVFCTADASLGIDPGSIVYAGPWIGLLRGGIVYPSIQLYEAVYSDVGFRAAIVVSEAGVKNFLYGRDVLEESVVEKYPPLNNPLAVIDREDMRVVGVAEPRRGYYRNVYDAGLFLRLFG